MELLEALRSRRSIRKYLPEEISIDIIHELLQAAQQAPSACNRQGWRFIYINDRNKIMEIKRRGGASFLSDVSYAILVIYDNHTDNVEYMDHIQSAAASIENMILRAHSLGIGTCWVCHLPPKNELRKIFGIPAYYDPIALVTLGWFDKQPKSAAKPPVDKILSINKYEFNEPLAAFFAPRLLIRRFFRRIYYLFPFRSILDKFTGRCEKRFDNE